MSRIRKPKPCPCCGSARIFLLDESPGCSMMSDFVECLERGHRVEKWEYLLESPVGRLAN